MTSGWNWMPQTGRSSEPEGLQADASCGRARRRPAAAATRSGGTGSLEALGQEAEQRVDAALGRQLDLVPADLGLGGRAHDRAGRLGQHLRAEADAEHRRAALEQLRAPAASRGAARDGSSSWSTCASAPNTIAASKPSSGGGGPRAAPTRSARGRRPGPARRTRPPPRCGGGRPKGSASTRRLRPSRRGRRLRPARGRRARSAPPAARAGVRGLRRALGHVRGGRGPS